MRSRVRNAALLIVALLAAAASVWSSGVAAAEEVSARVRISVLSSRPSVVAGGDALVRVTLIGDASPGNVRIFVDSTDVTSKFRLIPGGRALEGLVDGLVVGRNVVTAGEPGGRFDSVVLQNHPITGPVFAGPHETPFICDTAAFTTVAGVKLGAPIDEDCSVATRVDYIYRTTAGTFTPLPAGNDRPPDLAWTTTRDGVRVPYIVRVETGTINRAIYEASMLHDPSTPAPGPWSRSSGWNGRLVYTFGGGCPGGWYVQGRSTGGVTYDLMLRQGYAMASASLNVFGNNCNDLLASETMSMVKERFIETYGRPAFTLGWGCSGGAYQVHQIGDNYPGLLDGIIAGCSFPDVGFATLGAITDARLLNHYFTQIVPGSLTKDQQRAIAGFGKWETIANLASGAGRIDPRIFCPAQLPVGLRYDPVANPKGARCDVYDHTVNAYGRDPATGFARRPLDNVGIQFGLGALRNGAITVDQFLDLNERIGGFDADANFVPARTVANLDATRAAYRTGRMLNGGAGLAVMPIIDYRTYTDDAANGDIHLRFHSFSTRERLRKANGTSANQIMLMEDNRYGGFSTSSPVLSGALTQMDRWLTDIAGDSAPGSASAKIARNRPADLVDACWTRDATATKVVETQVEGIGTTTCNTLYPVWPSPRMVAGGPTASDIVKCRLRAIDPADYPSELTPAQEERLHAIYPGGVCNWSVPGVEQQPLAGTWLSFN